MKPGLLYACRAYIADEPVARLKMIARSHWDLHRRKRLDIGRWRRRFNVKLL
jgi:hypothetical protein